MSPKLNMTTKSPISVACCMPKQNRDLESKLKWLKDAVQKTDCHLFVTSQEYFGGHYIMPNQLHVERSWLADKVGDIARKAKKCIAVGACCKSPGAGATEDFVYFDSSGKLLGHHSKFALPSYDDCRTGGHGELWPETNFSRRITPIEIPELRLKVGTVFCWEVFSQAIWPCYSFAGVNLITHPIKFAPRGWLKNKVLEDGKKHIVGFGNAPKSQAWVDRLLAASRHQVLCPIVVSCNSWDLGDKMKALCGHVDEIKRTTQLHDLPSIGTDEKIHVYSMLPEYYTGLDHHHSAGAFKEHTGSVEGFSELGEWTMHGKIRRIEAHLIGGTTKLECFLKASTLSRQKKSIPQRAFGALQRIPRRRPQQ